jgi:hypothetical protein
MYSAAIVRTRASSSVNSSCILHPVTVVQQWFLSFHE